MQLPSFDPKNYEDGLKILEDMISNSSDIQHQLLEEIVTKNANTEYLKGFLHGQSDKELFKEKVPVVDYEDIKPYIERIANGEPSEIISADSIVELFRSSGTSSGKQKWIPTTAEETRRKAFFFNHTFNVLNKEIDGLKEGKRMYFVFIGPDSNTPGGLVVRNAVKSDFQSSKFRNICFNWFDFLTSPDEVILCKDTKQSMYCQLLCGLVQRDEVVRVGATFASGFLRPIKFLEEHWQELCSNIRTAQISDWITDPNSRKAISLILNKQMPDLANSIELACKEKSWEGIVKNLWPRTKCIEVILTGSMAQYIPSLEFYSGGIPLVSLIYPSSEGCFGINMRPLSNPYNVSYTLLPNMAYYEFAQVDDHPNENCMIKNDDHFKGGIVDLANVEVGHHYELLVTTFTGLYRYRVGDILMVTNFHKNAPEFKFVQRKNVVLSIDVEKTTEEDLFNAITKAMHIIDPLGIRLINRSSYIDISSNPGHYVLFWELQMRENGDVPPLDSAKMEQCCNLVEQSLDEMYKKLRNWKTIGPLEIRVVKQGTFDALMDFYLSQGTSLSQYKTPTCIKSDKAIQILNSRLIERFFSKVLPDLTSCSEK